MLEKHPLAVVRAVLGLTQCRFSERIGVSLAYLKRIERTSSPLTEEIARRVNAGTGVSLVWLLVGKGPPINFMGKPFTREWHNQWINMHRLLDTHEGIPTYINENEIVDLVGFIKKLNSTLPGDRFSANLRKQLPSELVRRIASYKDEATAELRPLLANELTKIVRTKNLSAPLHLLKTLELSEETKNIIAILKNRQDPLMVGLNRLILEDAYPGMIRRHQRAVDRADELAAEIGKFVRLICIAATKSQQPKLLAFYRAVIQSIYEIRDGFKLRNAYWSEWEAGNARLSPSIPKRDSSLLWMWDADGFERLFEVGEKSLSPFQNTANPGESSDDEQMP